MTDTDTLRHRAVRMHGRDANEHGRASTPLELLFDLTFVIAFGTAANELAHALSEGHVGSGVFAFSFTTFAIAWAWINFSWFASAYDTDDWLFRVTTLIQMVGVLVLALGIHAVFESVIEGHHLDNRVLVAGYVVMRIAMVAHWVRAWLSDRERRPAISTYIATILTAQGGWVALLFIHANAVVTIASGAVLLSIELAGPVLAETRKGGTPWHAHHIAERYGLVIIIALGEGMIGTMATLGAIVQHGWTLDAAVLGFAGTALIFGMWWNYFVIPHGQILHVRRGRSFLWSYGHIPIFGAVVAVGAGLHAAAFYMQRESRVTQTDALLGVVVPLATFAALLFAGYAALTRTLDPFHFVLIGGTVLLLGAAVAMSAASVGLPWCLLILAGAPWVSVLGYETIGHQHNRRVLEAL